MKKNEGRRGSDRRKKKRRKKRIQKIKNRKGEIRNEERLKGEVHKFSNKMVWILAGGRHLKEKHFVFCNMGPTFSTRTSYLAKQ